MKASVKGGVLLLMLFVGVATLFTSCYKVKDSIAKVTVVDSVTGDPVVGATVILRPERSSTEYDNYEFKWEEIEATTDAAGVATFNFNEDYEAGQAGLLVLTIDVNDGTLHSSVGIIKVEEQTTSEKTVEIP